MRTEGEKTERESAGPPSVRRMMWFVVRRPEQSFDNETPVPEPLKTTESLLYQGLDRMPWWDLDNLYRAGQLAPDLVPLYQSTRIVERPAELRSTGCLADALLLLRSSPRVEAMNEVVCAIEADQSDGQSDRDITWLGYDPVYKSATAFSLLGQVYLHRHGPMASAADRLNGYGLFDTAVEAKAFGSWYRELALKEEVEPLPLFDESFEVLAIGRYQGPGGPTS
jgi:hypothetical protein